MASPFDSTWQKYRAQAARGVSDKVEVLPRFSRGTHGNAIAKRRIKTRYITTQPLCDIKRHGLVFWSIHLPWKRFYWFESLHTVTGPDAHNKPGELIATG